jgi:hypothetical protein
MITIVDALVALRPNAEYATNGDDITWMDSVQTQPTDTEIRNEVVRLSYLEEVEEYKRVRELAYPSSGEQFDKIFHDGVDAWKADIQAIKDAHPKAVIDADELASRQALALFNHQLELYTNAQTRLAQYQVALGREEVIENQATGEQVWNEETDEMDDVMTDMVTVTAIEPLDATVEQTTYDEEGVATTSTVENPLITADVAERATAQAIVDATPQAVIDTYNE